MSHVRFGDGLVKTVGDDVGDVENADCVCDVLFDDGELRNVMAGHLNVIQQAASDHRSGRAQ